MNGPNVVYDVNLMETWYVLKPVERDEILAWLRSYGVSQAVRVEVYDDYMSVIELDKENQEHRKYSVAITSQPPRRLDGR